MLNMSKFIKDKMKLDLLIETDGVDTGDVNTQDEEFDPLDPKIEVHNYGILHRSELRQMVSDKLDFLKRSYESVGNEGGYKELQQIKAALKSINNLIEADMDASVELERVRQKGGRRDQKIPSQK